MAAGDNFFKCDANLGTEQAIRAMIYDDGTGKPCWSIKMAGSALDPFFDCEENKALSTEQVLRMMILEDGAGKPVWNVKDL